MGTDSTQQVPQGREDGSQRWVWGVLLLTIGLALLVARLTRLESLELLVLAVIGVVLLVLGCVRRRDGLLIPGGILTGIGVGTYLVGGPLEAGLTDDASGGVFLLAFAFGWALITVLSAVFTATLWWPLIVGGVLALIGIALLVGGAAMKVLNFVGEYWPAILVIIGAVLIVGFLRSRNRGSS